MGKAFSEQRWSGIARRRRCPRARRRLGGLAGGGLSLAFLLGLVLGCSEPTDTPASPRASLQSPTAGPSQSTTGAEEDSFTRIRNESGQATAPRRAGERPIPAFEGRTVAGTRLSMRELLGSRVLLFLFNPEIDEARPVATAVDRLSALRGTHNFQIVGVGVGSDPATLSRFVQAAGLDFPVIDDSNGAITSLLRLRAPVAVLGIDAEGYMSFGIGSFPSEGSVSDTLESRLREHLRLPDDETAGVGRLVDRPGAPELDVISMADGTVLRTASLEGRAAVVIFFLHTCPHCHKALAALETILNSIPEPERPRLVAISIQNDPTAVRRSLQDLGLEFFDPQLDPDGRASERWGVTGGVPVVLVLDSKGRITHRTTGWNEKRDPGIVRMKLAAAAGVHVPMLLDPKGYSGNDVCGTCHELEYATWEYTAHASAFDTLVTHAADRRTDCVGCHVVGFERNGGYDILRPVPHLENVGCESCHGRGGPHLSPDFVPEADYTEVCSTCHTPTHSLGFEYEPFHARVSHQRIAALSNAERARLEEAGGVSRSLLPTQAEHVGSNACQGCHAREFETWQASVHGRAVASLEKKGKAGDASCLACHTTAFGKPGGFPTGAAVADHPDLARVGCESCHGPGGDHVGPSARRVGTILSLGDKCDSCVILKICGSCHDDANDAGFRFHVEERIEAQRHGTIEPAATRGTNETAEADRVRLHRAFEEIRNDAPSGRLISAPRPLTVDDATSPG